MIEFLQGSLWVVSITLRISPSITLKAQHLQPSERRWCPWGHFPAAAVFDLPFCLLSSFPVSVASDKDVLAFSHSTILLSLQRLVSSCFASPLFSSFLYFVSHVFQTRSSLPSFIQTSMAGVLTHPLPVPPAIIPGPQTNISTLPPECSSSLPILATESCVSQWKFWVNSSS